MMLSNCSAICTKVEQVDDSWVQVPETFLIKCDYPNGELENDTLVALLNKVDQNTSKHYSCIDLHNSLVDLLIEREED